MNWKGSLKHPAKERFKDTTLKHIYLDQEKNRSVEYDRETEVREVRSQVNCSSTSKLKIGGNGLDSGKARLHRAKLMCVSE